MYKYLNENKDVGIVGPKVYLKDGSIQMINMGVKTGLKEKYKYLLRKTPFKTLVKDFLIEFSALDNDLTQPFEVHSVSGCCFMISEKRVNEITPFDENTFLYQEELIIGIKMEELNYKTIYLPFSEVVHLHGQSTKNIKAFSYTCLVESELYYFKRYLKSSILSLLPLYIIRTTKFLGMAIKHKDYRSNITSYFSKTTQSLIYNHY